VYLVDTNVLSELMRARPDPLVAGWARGLASMTISVITLEEIEFGLALRPSARLDRWWRAFSEDYCEILPLSPAIARRAAHLRATHRLRGRQPTQADMLIAATAHEHQLTLATRNQRDFTGCGIQCVNPFTALSK
jgi:toxin FitB